MSSPATHWKNTNRQKLLSLWAMLMFSLFATSGSIAQGSGGSFKNKKPIRKIGCCEPQMAKQKH